MNATLILELFGAESAASAGNCPESKIMSAIANIDLTESGKTEVRECEETMMCPRILNSVKHETSFAAFVLQQAWPPGQAEASRLCLSRQHKRRFQEKSGAVFGWARKIGRASCRERV